MECIGSFLVFMVDKICKIIFTLDSLANLFTVIGLPLTAYAIYYAKKAFEMQNEALKHQKDDSKEQKILGAWSLLAQKGTGDLGRKDALEFLYSQNKSLLGLDLSNAYLAGLNLKKADLNGCNFTGTNLREAHFEDAKLLKANFKDAKLWEAHFEGAFLVSAHFEGAYLHKAHFEGAKNIEYAKFENCFVWNTDSLSLPTAPEGYKFIFDKNEDGSFKEKEVKYGNNLRICYLIKLVKK